VRSLNSRAVCWCGHWIVMRHPCRARRFEPGEPSSGFTFVSEIKGGAVPKEYIPGVVKVRALPVALFRLSRCATNAERPDRTRGEHGLADKPVPDVV